MIQIRFFSTQNFVEKKFSPEKNFSPRLTITTLRVYLAHKKVGMWRYGLVKNGTANSWVSIFFPKKESPFWLILAVFD